MQFKVTHFDLRVRLGLPAAYTCLHTCVLQDPIYEKGKLAEIQGLILGMLDTFTYEQVNAESCISKTINTTICVNYDNRL